MHFAFCFLPLMALSGVEVKSNQGDFFRAGRAHTHPTPEHGRDRGERGAAMRETGVLKKKLAVAPCPRTKRGLRPICASTFFLCEFVHAARSARLSNKGEASMPPAGLE